MTFTAFLLPEAAGGLEGEAATLYRLDGMIKGKAALVKFETLKATLRNAGVPDAAVC